MFHEASFISEKRLETSIADIVNKEEWLGSPVNIKGANNDAKI